MISLAGRDILHGWGKFVFTGIGLGLLIGVTLTMAGVYRGMVDDARALLDNSGGERVAEWSGRQIDDQRRRLGHGGGQAHHRLRVAPAGGRRLGGDVQLRQGQGRLLRQGALGAGQQADHGDAQRRLEGGGGVGTVAHASLTEWIFG